jgi:flagellar basal-body rod protein FlgB
MSESNNIVDLINAGIRAEDLRQKGIAKNCANFETPGYRRVGVTFKELLKACSGSSDSGDINKAEPELYEPRQTPVNANGNDLSLETEVGSLVKNSLKHTTYVRLLRKKYAQIEMAIGAR